MHDVDLLLLQLAPQRPATVWPCRSTGKAQHFKALLVHACSEGAVAERREETAMSCPTQAPGQLPCLFLATLPSSFGGYYGDG